MNGAMRSASVAMTPAVTAAYNCTQFLAAGIGTRLASILDASPASKASFSINRTLKFLSFQIPQQIVFNTLLSEPQSTVPKFRKRCENSQPGCPSNYLVSQLNIGTVIAPIEVCDGPHRSKNHAVRRHRGNKES